MAIFDLDDESLVEKRAGDLARARARAFELFERRDQISETDPLNNEGITVLSKSADHARDRAAGDRRLSACRAVPRGGELRRVDGRYRAGPRQDADARSLSANVQRTGIRDLRYSRSSLRVGETGDSGVGRSNLVFLESRGTLASYVGTLDIRHESGA